MNVEGTKRKRDFEGDKKEQQRIKWTLEKTRGSDFDRKETEIWKVILNI